MRLVLLEMELTPPGLQPAFTTLVVPPEGWAPFRADLTVLISASCRAKSQLVPLVTTDTVDT